MSSRTNRRIRLTPSPLIFLMLLTVAGAKTIYVDDDAAGANNGSSWADAYTFLQDALADATLYDKPVEIRVAQGIYKPDQGANQAAGNREATFRLINGVRLKGGYAGLGQPDPDSRDIESYETILSGDLNGNDVDVAEPSELLNEPTRADNSFHVVTAYGVTSIAVMDGWTIGGGSAHGEEGQTRGGAVYCHTSRLEIAHCAFRGNTSVNGGAIFNDRSGELTLEDCRFVHNNADMLGGAINNTGRDCILILDHCTFTGNRAGSSGGAIMNGSSDPILTACTFEYNSSLRGGGIYNFLAGNPTLIDCTFIGNSVEHFGGGMYNNSGWTGQFLIRCTFEDNFAGWYGGGFYNSFNGRPLLENCIFLNNSSGSWGGAIHFWRSTGEIRNCTIVNNSAPRGGALGCGFENERLPSNVKINNSILWGNGEEIYRNDNSKITMTYSCVKGLILRRPGTPDGLINQDPCFAEPGYWVNRDDPNQVVGKYHPNAVWVDGDYHLKSQAGRWDPISQSWVADDVTSPGIDAGDPNSPVGEEPEPNGGRINMGAYGGTREASKSLVPETIVYMQWLGHASVKLWAEDCIVYVDPQNLSISPHDATLVLVTHSHGDHYSPSDIARVANAQTQFVAPPDVVTQYGSGQSIAPGQVIESYCARLIGVAAYNTNKTNHPK